MLFVAFRTSHAGLYHRLRQSFDRTRHEPQSISEILRLRFAPGLNATDITKYTGQCSSKIASEPIETAIFLFFVLNWSDSVGPTVCLINNGWHPASVLHSEIHGATMVRKRVIGEPPNLIHDVAPKRADIGRLTPDNAGCYNSDCRCIDGRTGARPYHPLREGPRIQAGLVIHEEYLNSLVRPRGWLA
jgi:hypothetical protein